MSDPVWFEQQTTPDYATQLQPLADLPDNWDGGKPPTEAALKAVGAGPCEAADMEAVFIERGSGCWRCHKNRTLKTCFGPGVHYKGEDLCRPCMKAAKKAVKP